MSRYSCQVLIPFATSLLDWAGAGSATSLAKARSWADTVVVTGWAGLVGERRPVLEARVVDTRTSAVAYVAVAVGDMRDAALEFNACVGNEARVSAWKQTNFRRMARHYNSHRALFATSVVGHLQRGETKKALATLHAYGAEAHAAAMSCIGDGRVGDAIGMLDAESRRYEEAAVRWAEPVTL